MNVRPANPVINLRNVISLLKKPNIKEIQIMTINILRKIQSGFTSSLPIILRASNCHEAQFLLCHIFHANQ